MSYFSSSVQIKEVQGALLLLDELGTLEVHDSFIGDHINTISAQTLIKTVEVVLTEDKSWFITGQNKGCLHFFSVH